MKSDKRIFLIFGDSIVAGILDKKGGWPQRLREFIFRKTLRKFYGVPITDLVYILGVNGDTTQGLLKRIYPEGKRRPKKNKEIITIISIGINDSSFAKKENRFLIPEKEFRKNIKEIINKARKFSDKIIFVGTNPVDEKRVNPFIFSSKGKTYHNKRIKKYNEIVKQICKKEKIPFIDLFQKLIKLDYKKLLADGLHPNSKGHQKIFEIVKEFLIKKKIV